MSSLRSCLVLSLAVTVGVWPAYSQARIGDEFGAPEVRIERELAWNHALRAERERFLLEAWAEAGPAARVAMEARLGEGLDAKHSRRRPLSLESVSGAWRGYVSGAEDPARLPWLNLLDSTDLRVIPGAFNARSEGRGEPMTVMVTSIWNGDREGLDPKPFGVNLIWTAPDGEESVARREVAEAANLESGFSMYLRPPISKPGVWWLTLELESVAGVVRSHPVPVECLDDIPALRTELHKAAASPSGHLQRSLLGRLEPLLEFGLRKGGSYSLASWLKWDDEFQGTKTGITPMDGGGLGAPGVTFWQLTESATGKGTLLLLAKKDESPLDVFSGVRQAQWVALGKACDLRVIAVQLPISSSSLKPLGACLSALDAADADGPLILVARGESGQVLPYLLKQFPQEGLDALVLSETLGAGAPLGTGLALPVLQIPSGLKIQASELLSEGQGLSLRARMGLRAPDPFAAYQANAVIRDWIQSL
jgi:hypothetical protein